jgi:hypothetical protein
LRGSSFSGESWRQALETGLGDRLWRQALEMSLERRDVKPGKADAQPLKVANHGS